MHVVHFCSTNPTKIEDVAHIFADSASPPRLFRVRDLVEPLTTDHDALVREKAMAAYRKALVPLFVEHGALHLDCLNGLPGPLVKMFWEQLEGRLGTLIPPGAARTAWQVQKICYCDGRRLHVFSGKIPGMILEAPRGGGGMHWEPFFVPKGHERTLGEMTRAERLGVSASWEAFELLRKHLKI